MSIIEYFPVALATVGIALRFWQSREAAPAVRSFAVRTAPPVTGKAPVRSVKVANSPQGELITA